MAANQTIIKAAGQRYSSVPTDYSGYLQGLHSVTNAIIEKTKATQKDKASVDKLVTDFSSKIKPYEKLVKTKISEAESPEEAMAISKHLGEQKLRYETYMRDLRGKLKGSSITNSIDPDTEYWMRSFGAGDFNNEYTVARDFVEKGEDGQEYPKSELHTFNMDFKIDENFNTYVMGPKGEYINMDEFENLLDMPNSTDGASVNALIVNFATLPENQTDSKGAKKSEDNFLKEKVKVKQDIDTLFKVGDGDISGDKVMTAFMFDEVSGFVEGGSDSKTSFIKWYLDNEEGDLFPPGFEEQYKDYSEWGVGKGEANEKMLHIIAQDLLKNDPNIKEDLERYIDFLLEKNR
tara:strand:- start:4662 stop:5705 length:1044 start_codon:yes stop_codon:yes gene_type:complete